MSALGFYNTTRNKWLSAQATTSLLPMTGELVSGFNNDPVIGEQYHICSDQKLKTSVIISVNNFWRQFFFGTANRWVDQVVISGTGPYPESQVVHS